MMKVIIIFYVCVALLPSKVSSHEKSDTYAQSVSFLKLKNNLIFFQQIHGKIRHQHVLDKIDKMIGNHEIINDVFKPSKSGFLGEGFFGIVHKGSNCRLNDS